MSKSNSILEIGCEELPVGFLTRLDRDSDRILSTIMKAMPLSCESRAIYLTPRRIILHLSGVERTETEKHLKIRGPRISSAYKDEEPTRALLGFLKGKGGELSDVVQEGDYVYIEKTEKIPELSDLLVSVFKEFFSNVYLPKSMFWKEKGLRFIRPIRWVLALLDGKVMDIALAGIKAGNTTCGHRYLGKTISVSCEQEFFEGLIDNGVIYDHNKRAEMIREEVVKLQGRENQALVMENALLCETPYVFRESIPEKFLELPGIVLETVMSKQQRYFACGSEEEPLPYFIAVSNNTITDKVREGHCMVLSARLSDGLFFYRNDLKVPMKQRAQGLSEIVFHQKLGNLLQKTERTAFLAESLAVDLYPDYKPRDNWQDIAGLSKADMLTEMVYEFPELQGTMGEIYLSEQGFSNDLSIAAREHYLPAGKDDDIPGSCAGSILSIAEKVDTLVSFFSAGITPTGSKDPFALRRMALGLLKVLIGKKLSMSLSHGISCSYKKLCDQGFSELSDPSEKLNSFLKERFYHMLREEFPHDLIESVCDTGFDDPYDSYLRIRAFSELAKGEGFREFTLLALRINNILKDIKLSEEPDQALFQDKEEKDLYEFFTGNASQIKEKMETKEYDKAYSLLLSFASPIDSFFEKVLVNCDDESVRKNRLSLLYKLQGFFLELFNIERIAEKSERSS